MMNLSRPRSGTGLVNTDREAYEKAKMRAEHLRKQKENERLLEDVNSRLKRLELEVERYRDILEKLIEEDRKQNEN